MHCNEYGSLVNDAFEDEVRSCACKCRRPSHIGCVRDTETQRLAELIVTRPVVAPSRGRRLQFVRVPVAGEGTTVWLFRSISS